MLWMLMAVASASEPNWSTDRGGIGDSTQTPGAGHVLVEAAVGATFADPVTIGTAGLVGRVGISDGFEVRVRVPDVQFTPDVAGGEAGVGVKVAAPSTGRWSASVVPELRIATQGGDLSGYLSANAAFTEGAFSSWVLGQTTWSSASIDLLIGGAVAMSAGEATVYVNAGRQVNVSTLVGAGGLWRVTDAVQVDVALDFYLTDQATFAPTVGVVAGF